MRRIAFVATLALAACQASGSKDPLVGFGPNPPLPAPRTSLIPQIGVPDVVKWAPGEAPTATRYQVVRFAEGLDHPRWLLALPNGDVLAALSAAEPTGEGKGSKGLRGFFQKMLMKKVGSVQKSADKIVLLRDADRDGKAEQKTDFATGLKQPFGMTLVGNTLYVANSDGVVSFPYTPGQTAAQGPPTKVFDLPGRPINHHWTKNVVASPDGTKLYATVGSNSNIGENGMAAEEGRAAIWEYDIASKRARVFATGIRNPNGLDFHPETNVMWTVSNERDEIGPDLPPDYLTSVRDGGFYGWPYSYWGRNVDARVKPQRPDLVARALTPDYALGPHTASLGLVFHRGSDQANPLMSGGAFVSQHGSWNRKPLNGYRVVFIPFQGGRPVGPPEILVTGFLNADQEIRGRPVGLAIGQDGQLLIADDVGGIVWKLVPNTPPA